MTKAKRKTPEDEPPEPPAPVVDDQTAAWLEITTATACLSMIRRTWSDEHLISYARLIHPGDRYKLRSAMHRRRS